MKYLLLSIAILTCTFLQGQNITLDDSSWMFEDESLSDQPEQRTVIPAGEEVAVLNFNDQALEVQYQGKTGFIRTPASNLDLTAPEMPDVNKHLKHARNGMIGMSASIAGMIASAVFIEDERIRNAALAGTGGLFIVSSISTIYHFDQARIKLKD